MEGLSNRLLSKIKSRSSIFVIGVLNVPFFEAAQPFKDTSHTERRVDGVSGQRQPHLLAERDYQCDKIAAQIYRPRFKELQAEHVLGRKASSRHQSIPEWIRIAGADVDLPEDVCGQCRQAGQPEP